MQPAHRRSEPVVEASPPSAQPESPARRDRWALLKAVLRDVRGHIRRTRVSVAAGAFAYRWFLSLFPLLIALLGIAALVEIPQHITVSLVHGVTKALPPGASDVLAGAITHATERTSGALATTVVASVVALWSATSGMVTLEEGLDMAYDVPSDRKFLEKRLIAVPLLFGSVVLGGAASALVVFGPQLGSAISSAAPLGGGFFSFAWTVVRWVVAIVIIFGLFAFVYVLAPNREQRVRQVFPGAALGTVVWALISLGFSWYTSSFGSYAKTYGAFAGVAILIFWLYLTGVAVLFGGELNAALERQLRLPSAQAPPAPPPAVASDEASTRLNPRTKGGQS